MRVGIIILADQRWADAERRWRLAEAYGFAHAWTYDHIGWRDLVDGPWFDAVPTLTAAARATSTIRLGTLVANPNFRHPAHFAREVTALDDISRGRINLGLGAGAVTGYDNDVLGQAPLDARARVERFGEFVGLLDRILRDERVTARGKYFSVTDGRGTPGCVQQPRVPFMIAASGPSSMRLAARHGDAWITNGQRTDDVEDWWRIVAAQAERFTRILLEAGRDPATVDRLLVLEPASPVYSLSNAAYFAEAVERADKLGFTDVIAHWPRESGWFAGDEAVLETVAADVLARQSP